MVFEEKALNKAKAELSAFFNASKARRKDRQKSLSKKEKVLQKRRNYAIL